MTTTSEAERISMYLIGSACSEKIANRYAEAVNIKKPTISRNDEALWHFALRGTFNMAITDSALALLNPYHPIRHRIYLMLAILEADVAFTHKFIAREHGFFKAFVLLAYSGLVAFVQSIIGLCVLKLAFKKSIRD